VYAEATELPDKAPISIIVIAASAVPVVCVLAARKSPAQKNTTTGMRVNSLSKTISL
jgi:hypothetical protein